MKHADSEGVRSSGSGLDGIDSRTKAGLHGAHVMNTVPSLKSAGQGHFECVDGLNSISVRWTTSVSGKVKLLLFMFLLLMGAFSLQRLITYLASVNDFAGIHPADVAKAFVLGTRFDLVISCMLLIPLVVILLSVPELNDRRKHGAHLAALYCGLAGATVFFLAVVDYFFFREFGERLNHKVFDYARSDYVHRIIRSQYPYVTALVAALGVFVALSWWVRRLLLPKHVHGDHTIGGSAWLLLALIPLGLGIRGSLGPKPINLGPAYFHHSNRLAQLALNGLFTLREAAIHLRSLCWAGLGLLLLVAGVNHPKIVLWGLVVLLALFSAGGALGGVPYTDIVGKVIPARMRGRFFAVRQASGNVLSIGAAVLAGKVLRLDYPINYALLFFLSALSLSVASLGVWAMREPLAADVKGQKLGWISYFRSLGEPLWAIRTLATISVSTGFCLMAMPFYIVAAKQVFDAPCEATALSIAAFVLGSLLGDFAWGRLVDRFGSRSMILSCVLISALTPMIALSAWVVGWQILVLVIGLMGATVAGRSIGFTSALLEIAPPDRRAIYTATYALTYVPLAIMPLLGGIIAETFSFRTLFVLATLAMFTSLPVAWKWNKRARGSATRGSSFTHEVPERSTLFCNQGLGYGTATSTRGLSVPRAIHTDRLGGDNGVAGVVSPSVAV